MPIDFSKIDQIINQLRYVRSGDIVLSSDHNSQNDAIKELTDLLKSHPRPPAMIIAASDTPETLKQKADYICDGVSDQVEINEALTKSSTVVLCDGTYQIDDAIVVPDNSCIIGLANATIRTSRNESFDFVRVIGKSNVKICGIRFHLPFKPSEGVYICAIYIENSTNVIVEGCEFTGFFGTGVFVIGGGGWCRDVRVVRNRFDGTNGDIYFENCINFIASENVSYNCDYYSIFLWTSSGVISKNLFRDCGTGIGVSSYVDEWFEGQLVVISDNVIASSLTFAIDVYCFPAIVISNNCVSVKPGEYSLSVICVYDVELSVISGNCVDGGGSASHGIYVDYWDVTTAHCYVMQNVVRNVSQNGVFGWLRNINVTGNVIYRCGRNGIALITWDGVISSNVVHTTSQEENNRWSSIYVEYSENLVIEGNRCYVGDEANKPKYGIYIDSTCQYVMVHGNNLYQSGVTGDLYIASGTNTKARDNIGNNGEWLPDATVTGAPGTVLLAVDDTDVSMTGTTEVELKNFRFMKTQTINVVKLILNFSLWVSGGTGTLRIYIDDESSPRLSESTTSTSETFFYEKEIDISNIALGIHTIRIKAVNSGNYEVHQRLLEVYGVLSVG